MIAPNIQNGYDLKSEYADAWSFGPKTLCSLCILKLLQPSAPAQHGCTIRHTDHGIGQLFTVMARLVSSRHRFGLLPVACLFCLPLQSVPFTVIVIWIHSYMDIIGGKVCSEFKSRKIQGLSKGTIWIERSTRVQHQLIRVQYSVSTKQSFRRYCKTYLPNWE